MANDKEMVMATLLGAEDSAIHHAFLSRYCDELEEFAQRMGAAFDDWGRLDRILCENNDKEGATVSALLYAALNSHVVGMKLLISGLFIPSGNTRRYCLESLAMALLCSKPELGVLNRYMAGIYSPNKAVRDVKRHASKLHLFDEAIEQLQTHVKHYDQFSHPSQLSLSSLMLLESPCKGTVLGGAYDKGKEIGYDKEITSRTSMAGVFPNVVFGVARNWPRLNQR